MGAFAFYLVPIGLKKLSGRGSYGPSHRGEYRVFLQYSGYLILAEQRTSGYERVSADPTLWNDTDEVATCYLRYRVSLLTSVVQIAWRRASPPRGIPTTSDHETNGGIGFHLLFYLVWVSLDPGRVSGLYQRRKFDNYVKHEW